MGRTDRQRKKLTMRNYGLLRTDGAQKKIETRIFMDRSSNRSVSETIIASIIAVKYDHVEHCVQ